jgi:regulator of replication initiation timing
MNTSPMKTISRAVDSTKKCGKRAIHKVDKIVDRTVTKRMSNEFEPKTNASNDALTHRVRDLEKQNTKLSKENKILDEKCEELMTENKKLRLAMQESKMRWRKENWTDQDEHEWQHSKRLRMDEQRLIRSPLWQHLENVQFTDDINNKWMNSGKDPFSLQFPSHWARASELDQRDRALDGIIAPPATPSVPTAAPSSSQKRDQVSAFKRGLDIEANKRNKRV